MGKIIESKFTDDKGVSSKVMIQSLDETELNMSSNTYKIAPELRRTDKKQHKENILTSDIGVKSHGFTQIATLATIIAIGIFVVGYIFFKM